MPKLNIIYDLPEEREEFMDALNGWQWRQVVKDLDELLRTKIKYHGRNDLQEVRDELHAFLNGEGLSLWG
jgi:hypothetical protein